MAKGRCNAIAVLLHLLPERTYSYKETKFVPLPVLFTVVCKKIYTQSSADIAFPIKRDWGHGVCTQYEKKYDDKHYLLKKQ